MEKSIIILSISLIFAALILNGFAAADNDSETDNMTCKNLYWIDNDNKDCGQKEFCGAYMYYGLFTFENETECQQYVLASSGSDNNFDACDTDSDCIAPSCPTCKQPKCIDGECKMQNIVKSCPSNSSDEDGKCIFNLSNGRKSEVKIMPSTASARAIERLGELGFTVELKEVGKGNETKPVYELTGKKQGKFLGIFKIMVRVQAQVDAGTGDVKVIKPWWSFLASGI